MLNMYYNGSETVIAESVEDAAKVWFESTGDDWYTVSKQDDLDDWTLVHKENWTVTFEDSKDANKFTNSGILKLKEESEFGYWKVSGSEEDWIEVHGRGFFCTENW